MITGNFWLNLIFSKNKFGSQGSSAQQLRHTNLAPAQRHKNSSLCACAELALNLDDFCVKPLMQKYAHQNEETHFHANF
jgi:hypothetical protein